MYESMYASMYACMYVSMGTSRQTMGESRHRYLAVGARASMLKLTPQEAHRRPLLLLAPAWWDSEFSPASNKTSLSFTQACPCSDFNQLSVFSCITLFVAPRCLACSAEISGGGSSMRSPLLNLSISCRNSNANSLGCPSRSRFLINLRRSAAPKLAKAVIESGSNAVLSQEAP